MGYWRVNAPWLLPSVQELGQKTQAKSSQFPTRLRQTCSCKLGAFALWLERKWRQQARKPSSRLLLRPPVCRFNYRFPHQHLQAVRDHPLPQGWQHIFSRTEDVVAEDAGFVPRMCAKLAFACVSGSAPAGEPQTCPVRAGFDRLQIRCCTMRMSFRTAGGLGNKGVKFVRCDVEDSQAFADQLGRLGDAPHCCNWSINTSTARAKRPRRLRFCYAIYRASKWPSSTGHVSRVERSVGRSSEIKVATWRHVQFLSTFVDKSGRVSECAFASRMHQGHDGRMVHCVLVGTLCFGYYTRSSSRSCGAGM